MRWVYDVAAGKVQRVIEQAEFILMEEEVGFDYLSVLYGLGI